MDIEVQMLGSGDVVWLPEVALPKVVFKKSPVYERDHGGGVYSYHVELVFTDGTTEIFAAVDKVDVIWAAPIVDMGQ